MNLDAFVSALPQLYGGDLLAEHPVDRRFRRLLDDVPGMASENKLMLLNLAGRLLDSGEIYLEVGAFKGLSIIAAALDNAYHSFVSIENFSEFGMDEAPNRASLFDNLRRWGVADRVTVVEGDCLSEIGTTVVGPVGIYFYDGHHHPRTQYRSVAVAESILADEALVIIDDTGWRGVAESVDRYMANHDRFRLLFDLPSRAESDPRWWNGVRVYGYQAGGWLRRAR